MLKRNEWNGGERDFAIGPLPSDHVGRPGPVLMPFTVDQQVGPEVCLLLKEEPGYAEQYGQVAPLDLLATSGLIRTPYGIVPYVVWTVAAGSAAEAQFEHFFNPNEMSTLRLLASAANQTHLKLIVVDCISAGVTAFVDYPNSFGLDELAQAIVGTMGHETGSDFARAVAHLKANVPLDVLTGKRAS